MKLKRLSMILIILLSESSWLIIIWQSNYSFESLLSLYLFIYTKISKWRTLSEKNSSLFSRTILILMWVKAWQLYSTSSLKSWRKLWTLLYIFETSEKVWNTVIIIWMINDELNNFFARWSLFFLLKLKSYASLVIFELSNEILLLKSFKKLSI
jgi:hypothetical protein